MDRIKIVEKYRNGKSVPEIIKETKYKSTTSIYNILEEEGVERRNKSECQKPIKISENKLKQLYYDKDKTLREIGDIYNWNAETIRRLFIKYNIKRKGKTRNFGGWNKGKKMSEGFRKNLSIKRKNMFENGELEHWNKGNKRDGKTKEKISKSLKGRFIGEENSNWKGGANTKNQKIRRRVIGNYQYKKWRKEVYKRDDYICQLCRKKSEGDLEAHHIIPIFKNYNLIFDVNNGITLCKDCHRKIRHKESKYVEFFRNKIKEKKSGKGI